jgi:two-component system CheB/CheR fusion protein
MMDPQISPEIKAHLDRAVEELGRVSHITQQSLAFHRGTGLPAMIDLQENSVEGVLRRFARRLAAKELCVKTRYRGDTQISALGGEVRQVLANLLSSSMDAVKGGGRVELRLSGVSRRDGSSLVRFTIGDNGSGIPAERLSCTAGPGFSPQPFGLGQSSSFRRHSSLEDTPSSSLLAS